MIIKLIYLYLKLRNRRSLKAHLHHINKVKNNLKFEFKASSFIFHKLKPFYFALRILQAKLRIKFHKLF